MKLLGLQKWFGLGLAVACVAAGWTRLGHAETTLSAARPTPAEAAMLYRDDQMPAEAYERMVLAQSAALHLNFPLAHSLIDVAEKLSPEHPLGYVMEIGIRLFEIQEDLEVKKYDKKKIEEFFVRDDALIAMAEAREKLFPKSPYPKMYLGGAYGCRGLVNLYQSNYFTSYVDGNKGVDYLKQAVKLDSSQYNAYMGLGQFDYYCGRLSGVLQFFLALRGDEKRGITTLKVCVDKATYSAIAASIFLAKVLTQDQKDWIQAEPYVRKAYEKYPDNYHHGRYMILLAKGFGLQSIKGRELLESVCAQWDKGYRPPEGADYPLEPARLELARFYLASKDVEQARKHLRVLKDSRQRDVAVQASELLQGTK